MSEVESVDREERKRRAEARLAASRPRREAAAAAHARSMVRPDAGEGAVVRTSLAELAANQRPFTEAERQRLEAMTEEEIEAAALADPDNPPWTDEELATARRERDERLAAEKRRASGSNMSHGRRDPAARPR